MLRRRSPLQARKPLAAGTPLRRATPLAAAGRKRRESAQAEGRPVKPALTARWLPAVPDEVGERLAYRSDGVCEMQLPGCWGRATDPAHRIGQGSGGRHGEAKIRNDRLSNLLHACRPCHEWTHREGALAKDDGLRLDDWQNPLTEPALYRGVLSFLDDAGNVHDFEDVGA